MPTLFSSSKDAACEKYVKVIVRSIKFVFLVGHGKKGNTVCHVSKMFVLVFHVQLSTQILSIAGYDISAYQVNLKKEIGSAFKIIFGLNGLQSATLLCNTTPDKCARRK